MSITQEEMAVDYWLHVLSMKEEIAAKEHVTIESLDDLLLRSTVEERFKEIEEEDRRVDEIEKARTAERESLIAFNGE